MHSFLIQHAGTIIACIVAAAFLKLVYGELTRRLYP